MNTSYTPSQIDRLRRIPLNSILQIAGARQDHHDKSRWHTCSGAISVTGTKFFNWNSQIGGGGAIDMVMHLYNLSFKDTVTWLRMRFPEHYAPEAPAAALKPTLRLPAPDHDNLATVGHYLVAQRKLPGALIQLLIQSGDLYADHRANAVFLARGSDNTAVGAELRGTSPCDWRGMAPGSCKDLGYFSIRQNHFNAVIICESAIDAVSCLAIHPSHWCISSAGARPNPAWLPILLRQHLQIYCGFDADTTGETMAQNMIRSYPTIKRLRPKQHDWNDLLRLPP